jgi:hypothetical protein
MPSATWHDIFENDEDAALIGAQALRDNGLLRTQTGPSLQCNVKIGNAVKRCYCVSGEILTWAPSSKSYNPARNKLGNELNNANGLNNIPAPTPNGALPAIPLPPSCPANFSELSPEQKQNFLLSSAMYLQARLLNSGIALEAQDARTIAQLASVAQGIVQTSVKLEQIRVERRQGGEEVRRWLCSKISGETDDDLQTWKNKQRGMGGGRLAQS